MANLTITQNCYWGGPEYDWAGLVYGNSVNVNGGAILTVDPSVFPPVGFDLGVSLSSYAGFSKVKIINNTITPIIHYGPVGGSLRIETGCTLEIEGDYIYLYTGDGSINQSFLWSSSGYDILDEPACLEVETGSGTNIFEQWVNIAELQLSDIGVNTHGKWFKYDPSTSLITFGDNGVVVNQGGNIVLTGARVRCYNIGIGMKNNSNIRLVTGVPSNDYELDIQTGGILNVNKCLTFGFYWNIQNAGDATLNKVGSLHKIFSDLTAGLSFTEVIVCLNRYYTTVGRSFETGAYMTVQLSLTKCKFASKVYGTGGYWYTTLIRQTIGAVIDQCEFWLLKRSKNTDMACDISGKGALIFNNCLFVGARVNAGGEVIFDNCKFAQSPNNTADANTSEMISKGSGSKITLKTCIDSLGSTVKSGISQLLSISNLFKIIKTSYNTGCNYGISCGHNGVIADVDISGWSLSLIYSTAYSKNKTYQNVRGDRFYGPLFNNAGTGSIFKAVDCATIPTNANWGYDSHFYEARTSTNGGLIGVLFTPKTINNTNYTVVGNVKFDLAGKMYMPGASGDSITFTWPHNIIGISQINGTLTLGGLNMQYFTVEYSIDNGATWLASTATTEINIANGPKLQIRLTHTRENITDYLNLCNFSTVVDYINYKYPIDTFSLSIGPVDPSTEIRIMEHGTQNELAGIENVGSTGYFTYEYSYSGTPFFVDINILHATTYENRFIKNVELAGENKSILIEQTPDRWYKNP